MSGSAPAPFRAAARPSRPQWTAGYTMVELLTVIVIISILAAITMSVSKAIAVKQNLAKATGEMDLIYTALQSFHRDNLEYPPMDNDAGTGSPYAEENLLMAIAGHAHWTTDGLGEPIWEFVSMAKKFNDGSPLPKTGKKYTWGKQYVELAKLQVDTDPSSDSGYKDGAVIYDPWGKPYLYRYKEIKDLANPASRNWQATTFLLISRGPDKSPDDAEANFLWKVANKRGAYTGLLSDEYGDPNSNPDLADNLVRGSITLPQ